MNKKKVSLRTTVIALVLAVVLTTMVVAVVLHTLIVPMTFDVSEEYGLKLWSVYDDAEVTSIAWGSFSSGQQKTYKDDISAMSMGSDTLVIMNTGNSAVNVTLTLVPSGFTNGVEWNVTHTYAPQEIAKGGFSSEFDIAIKELDANADDTYSCQIKIEAVDWLP